MNISNYDFSQQRIAELEAENARLRWSLDMARTERRELREKVYGPYSDDSRRAEEELELIEFMKNRVPGEGMKFFRELSLLSEQSS